MPVLRSTPDHTSLKCRCSNYCCVQFRHVHLTREWRVIRLSKLEINHEQSAHEQNMRVTVDIVFAWMEKKNEFFWTFCYWMSDWFQIHRHQHRESRVTNVTPSHYLGYGDEWELASWGALACTRHEFPRFTPHLSCLKVFFSFCVPIFVGLYLDGLTLFHSDFSKSKIFLNILPCKQLREGRLVHQGRVLGPQGGLGFQIPQP